MSRYDWFKKEAVAIRLRKFFDFEPGPASDLTLFEDLYGPLPADYREFVQEFGQARLFRHQSHPWHCMLVFAPPRAQPLEAAGRGKGARPAIRIEVGHHINSGSAWFQWDGGVFAKGGAIFAGHSCQPARVIPSFEDWLKKSFFSSKKLYSKTDWQAALKPAPPFSEREKQIVEALPNFGFKKVGVSASGDIVVHVQNNSSIELPFLTLGVRGESGMEGAVAFRTRGILPGMSGIIEQDAYRGSMDPQQVELFRLPQPEPEDRPYYFELNGWLSSGA
jgi:hypothetical protein